MKLVVIVVLALVGVTVADIGWPGPCYFSVAFVPTPENSYQDELEIPATCNNGTIAWQDPKDKLLIYQKRPGVTFCLCLYYTFGTYLGQVEEIRGNKITKINIPTKNNSSCTESYQGETYLLLTGIQPQTYQTRITFDVTLK